MTDIRAHVQSHPPIPPPRAGDSPHGGVLPAGRPALAAGAPSGGDGGVTSLQDGGGPVLANAEIVLIFWGTAWGTAATTPTRDQCAAALHDIVEGAWGTQLAQYRGIGRASIVQTVDWLTSEAPATFVESDISGFVESRVAGGDVIAPDGNTLYCVILPTGHSSGDTPFVGRHQDYARGDGTTVYYAWVTNDGTLTGGNSVPKVFSHEVAEAIADPKVSGPTGITLNGDGDEIGDVCNTTFVLVNGHAEEAYWSQADNRCVVPIVQSLPRTVAAPVLVQSRFGRQGNFELVSASDEGNLFHAWRNNDNPFMPWSAAIPFGDRIGRAFGVAMIQSDYGDPGNLEVVCNIDGRLLFFWRDSGPSFTWNGPYDIEPTFSAGAGNPALVQSRFGEQGNFELVVPAAGGGLAHFWRNNDDPSMPWSGPTLFGGSLSSVSGVALIASNYGDPGNLEVVCVAGGQLQAFWRDSGPAFTWNGPYAISPETPAHGTPALIQSRFGSKGNFELVVPGSNGGLFHLWRNNDDPAMPWSRPFAFGESLGLVDGVTLIQSNYGDPGNLEVIGNYGATLQFFWRDSGPGFVWSGPYEVAATTW